MKKVLGIGLKKQRTKTVKEGLDNGILDSDLASSMRSTELLGLEGSVGGRDASVKFKMMIMGDLSSYKSEMMSKYFGKNSEEIIMSLT